MSCICVVNLRNLLAALLPLIKLAPIQLSPAMAQLNSHAGAISAPSNLSFNPRLALSLPPLPLSLHAVEQIAATANAMEALTATLGFSPLSVNGPSGLSLTVSSFNFNLAALLPLMPHLGTLPALTGLSLALSTVAQLRASLGVDLLVPKVALEINAALGLPGKSAPPPAINLAAAARAQAYAKLSAAATVFGGPGRLLPSLALCAQLRLPQMHGNLSLLAMLAALLGLRANLHSLGFVNLTPGLIASLRATLKPLATIPPLAIRGSAAGVTALPTLNASFMASARAIAGLDLHAAANLRLPNLAPLALLASVANTGGLGSTVACSGSCPVGKHL